MSRELLITLVVVGHVIFFGGLAALIASTWDFWGGFCLVGVFFMLLSGMISFLIIFSGINECMPKQKNPKIEKTIQHKKADIYGDLW